MWRRGTLTDLVLMVSMPCPERSMGCDRHQGRVSMRYGLLCTSALISAGFVASQAQAADPIKLTLGGFYGAAAGAEIGVT